MLGRPARSLRRIRVAFLGVLVAVGLGGCSESADDEMEARFGIRRPLRVQVAHHVGSGPGMDHSDAWVLAPVDDAFLAEVVRVAKLRRRADGEPLVSGLASTRWPAWWDAVRIEALPEAYGRDGADEHWRVWIDRSAGRMYLQWFST